MATVRKELNEVSRMCEWSRDSDVSSILASAWSDCGGGIASLWGILMVQTMEK